MRLSRLRVPRAALAVCAATLAVTSMSGVASATTSSGRGSTVAAAKSCSPDPGVSDSEIKIGSVVSTSGAGAQVAGQIEGIKARIAMANDTNELGKRKITWIQKDDGGDPARNTAAVQELTEQDKVFAIIVGSLAFPASAQYMNAQGIPGVGWQFGMPIFGQYDNFIGFQNSGTPTPDTMFSSIHADALKREGAKKVAIIGYSQASSARFINQLGKAIENDGSMTVAYQSTDVPAGNTDWSSYAQKIKESGADSLYLGMDTQSSLALFNALTQAGVQFAHVNFISGYDSRVLAIPAINGGVFAVEWKPFEVMKTDGSKGYANYTKYLEQVAPGTLQNSLNSAGWLAADAMVTGLKNVKDCPTRKAFIKKMYETKNYTADGWFAPIAFAKEKGLPNRCYYYAQAETASKSFVPLFDGKRICAGVLYDGDKKIPLTADGYPTKKASSQK